MRQKRNRFVVYLTNIIRCNYFADCNKRTSVIFLISLCMPNKIDFNLTNEQVYEITIKVAEEHLSIPDIEKLIFQKR